MDNNISVDELSTLLKASNNIAILTHERPDGDALASALAIFWYLIDIKKTENNIDILIPSYLDDFSFIPGIKKVKKFPTKEKYDLMIIVDCAKLHLLNGKSFLAYGDTIICIDHHMKNEMPCKYHIFDSQASSCTCILYKFLNCKTKQFLNCIAIGLVADTALLTTKLPVSTQDILLELIEDVSIDISSILDHLEANDRTKELAIIANSRGKIRTNNKETVYCTYLLQSDLSKSESSLEAVNHESIIYEIQQNSGITFDSLIFVMQKNTKEYKVSLRTTIPRIDLVWICSNLISEGKLVNGGGHKDSAGCTIAKSYSIEEIFEFLSNAILF